MTDPGGSNSSGDSEAMTFPCELDIKVFSKTDVDLESRIEQLLCVHLAREQVLSVSAKESSKGKFRSLSCKVIAHSREQIDLVYADLGKHPDVIMLL